jgi:hypothetical protein
MGYPKDLTGNFVIGAAVIISLAIEVRREQSSGDAALAH